MLSSSLAPGHDSTRTTPPVPRRQGGDDGQEHDDDDQHPPIPIHGTVMPLPAEVPLVSTRESATRT